MFRKVAIVGVAQTDYKDNWAHQSKREMIYEVTKEALSNAGLVKADLDTVIEATSDYWDGTSCSNVPILTAAGAYLKEESKVEDDGAFAFIYAYMRVLSGLFNTALVISHTKCSETPPISTLTHVSFDTIYQRPIGLDDISSAALQAQLYMHKYGISEEQVAEISVKNLGNAFNNPHAHRRMKISVEDVFESEMLAYPLRALNCRPASDGACAVIMASEEKAKEITDTPAWIRGVGHNVDSYYLGDRDLVKVRSLREAASRAYRMAGIEDPRRQIDVAEVCEPFSHQELLWYEHLGFCGEGEGGKLMDEGITATNGELPVNPSGGVLSTNPYVARGLIRVAEAALQVMGRAGRRQIPDVEVSLAHGISGMAGQMHGVILLGG